MTLPGKGFLRYLGYFGRLAGWHRFLLFALLTLLTTWSEFFGIALLLPLLQSGGTFTSGATKILDAIQWIGLPRDTRGVLAALVLVAVAKALLTFVAVGYQHYLSAKITQDLRRSLLGGICGVEYRYFQDASVGRLVAILFSDTVNTSTAFLTFTKLVPSIVTIVVYFGIVTFVRWPLVAIILAAGGVAFFLVRLPARVAKRYNEQSTAESIKLGSDMVQSLQSFKYLVATGNISVLRARIGRSIRQLTVLSYKLGALSAASFAVPQPIVMLFLAGIMLFQLETRGERAIAAGIVLLLLVYRTINELFALQTQWHAFYATTASVDLVDQTAKELAANQEKTRGGDPPVFTREISLDHVTFRYGERVILDDLTLRIPRHQAIALVGASGAGKTTAVDLVSGLLKPTAGKVTVDGRDLRHLDLGAWREKIGYVPQEVLLFDDHVAANISLWAVDPADPRGMERVREAGRRAYADEFIARAAGGYLAPVGDRGLKLSGGQRQRLAIARELFRNPELLILDEATSALDTESEHIVRQSIEALKGSVTVLVIAHRLSTIKGCDRVYVLENGRLREEGSYEELMAREGSRFRELARMQAL